MNRVGKAIDSFIEKDQKKHSWVFGVAIFEGKKKVEEIEFKSEEDMAFWLYKNELLKTE